MSNPKSEKNSSNYPHNGEMESQDDPVTSYRMDTIRTSTREERGTDGEVSKNFQLNPRTSGKI